MRGRWTPKRIALLTGKVIGYIALSVVVLLVLVALAIQIPYVQRTLVQKGVSFLENKIGTRVALEHFSLSFPKAIVLDGIYLEDQKADTLIYIGRLSLDTDLWALTRNTIELNDVTIEHADIRVMRSADSLFNFSYILNAFAGNDETTDTTTSTPWTFNIEDINLADIRASYLDSIVALKAAVSLHELNISIDELDLSGPSIRFDDIALSDVRADVLNWQAAADHPVNGDETAADSTSGFNLGFNTISLNNIAADYRQTVSGQHARANIGTLSVDAREVDLLKRIISLNTFELSETFLSYQQANSPEAKKTDDEATPAPPANAVATGKALDLGWNITLDQLSLSNNNLQYYDFNSPSAQSGIDFTHLWLTRFSLKAKDLRASDDGAQANIESASFSEQSGLFLDQLQASLKVGATEASLEDLLIQTSQSTIRGNAKASYRSLDALATDYPSIKFDLSLPSSTIAADDVLLFAPDLLSGLPLKNAETRSIVLQTKINGRVDDMHVEDFRLSLMDSTSLILSGRVTGLPDERSRYALKLSRLYTTRKDLKSLLADSLLPASLDLPRWLQLTGTSRGTFVDPAADLVLTSEYGTVSVDAALKNLKASAPAYTARVETKQFDMGKLLRQSDNMGKLTMHVSASGKGFTKETIQSKVDLVANEFLYQDYAYRDFNIHGTLTRFLFSGKAWLKDPNLDFTLDGDLDYTQDVPSYALKLDLVNADFRALRLSERPLKARGIFETKLATRDFTSINGNLDIRKVGIYNGEALYLVDSLLFASIDQKGESKISIRSDIISGDFEGTINLAAMPEAMRRHFNNYFSLNDPAYAKPTDIQKFDFNLVIRNTELITEILVPELEPFVPGRIEGKFDSEAKILNIRAEVSQLQYGGVGLDSLTLNVESDPDALDYTLGLRKIRFDTLRMEALRITGKVASDSIRTRLLILDSLQKKKYEFGGAFYSMQEAIQFRFLPEQVTMNYAPWTTPADNHLRFTKQGILAHNFSITNINERISLVTREEKDARTAIVFKDLNLQNITNIVEAKVLADGLINGDFMLSGTGQFKTALTVKALEILGVEWGDLALNLAHESSGQYVVDLGLNGINMEVGVKGTYVPDSIASRIDMALDISRINLIAIEPLSGGQIKNSTGGLTGEVTVKGSPSNPEIRGFLTFQKASLVPSFVNSKFLLQDERIAFTGDGVVLENFRILDEQNNVATIKGILKTSDYTAFDMDLSLTARNFQLLNTKEGDNELFYGKVGINTTATIHGSFSEPKVNMNVSLNDDSNFTYIIPQSEKGVLEQKGIVVFKDKDAAKDPFLRSINPKDSLVSRFTGIDLTANIELNDKEQLSIVIDPVTGDKLSVKGNATLTLAITPSGDMQMAGRYEITEGTYDFTFYRLVKRSFKIDKGSSITWSGNPLEAMMDIQASYEVETTAIELLALTDPPAEWRQRLPFLVYLHLNGELMTPDIRFELDMPVEKRNVLSGAPYSRIQDINTRESDLNKQVFALLILKRFITDNVFDSQSGSSVEATARRSVSRLLSDQLNRLAENIKGVELSFDVRSDEDYTTGQAQGTTAVQLGVSKSLLDDRLIVKVSGNVDIEGNKANQNSFADYVGDLALEYKLTEDGRFRITGFRNTNYDIISGELIETGAGLIYIKDYDTLRELFLPNAKRK